MRIFGARATVAAALVSGCALVPDVPIDLVLPVTEILAHSACELRRALNELDRDPAYRRFRPRNWLITISIAPTTDTDLNASGGFTRRVGNASRFTTWALSGPGAFVDAKGDRAASVTYTFKSPELMADEVVCFYSDATPTIHLLTRHLGIGNWLRRTATALTASRSALIDKPVYNTDITIKIAANGSWSYTFPAGLNLASAGASYSVDERLNISMAPYEPPRNITAVTLPAGDNFGHPVAATRPLQSSESVQAARDRLDIIQLEQAIRSLQQSQSR
jgi:hypothetical protein